MKMTLVHMGRRYTGSATPGCSGGIHDRGDASCDCLERDTDAAQLEVG